MRSDYKFNFIRIEDNLKIVDADFYCGNITTEDELNEWEILVPITRYRRSEKKANHVFTFPINTSMNEIKAVILQYLVDLNIGEPIEEL